MKSLFKFAIVAGFGYFVYVVMFGTPSSAQIKTVEVPRGASVKEIAATLKTADLIRSKFGFETLVWLKRASSKLQAGEYTFEGKMSLTDIVRKLTGGLGAKNERELTIVEGWTVDEIGVYLEEQGVGTKKEFFELVKSEKCNRSPLLIAKELNLICR